MGTRSDIIIKTSHKGKPVWARIYCHWDGYPSHNGKILKEHYHSQKTVASLVRLGNLSILGPQADRPDVPKMDHHVDGNHVDGYCLAYGRDRGEANSKALIFNTLDEAWPSHPDAGGIGGTEYTYVWDGKSWHVGDPDKDPTSCYPLEDVIAGKATINSAIYAWGGIKIGQRTAAPIRNVSMTSSAKKGT